LYGGAESPFPPVSTPGLIDNSSSDESEHEILTPINGSPTILSSSKQNKKQLGFVDEKRGIHSAKTIEIEGQGVNKDPDDFLWIMTEEPHRSRRKAILKAHPEVNLVAVRLLAIWR
jgi:hypothetical protein